jgi:predicted transposase YbfD/YdcC
VFSIISPGEFLECFLNWMAGILRLKGKHVAFAGKAVRAACDKVHGKQAPVLVNAYLVQTGICVGQIRVDEKTNEIKGIPELMEWLDLEGAVVSIDAIGCQKDIAELVCRNGADFVLQVKDNQSTLLSDIILDVETRIHEKIIRDARNSNLEKKGYKIEDTNNDPLDVYEEFERDHGRIERRTYYILNDNACVNLDDWPHVMGVGMVYRERLVIKRDEDGEIINEEPSMEYSAYIMSKHMDAQEFASYARGHWGIENSLHWVLDDYFREDRCTARMKLATEELGLMRKIINNLTELDGNVQRMSMKAKEVYYKNNPDAIWQLIFREIPSQY